MFKNNLNLAEGKNVIFGLLLFFHWKLFRLCFLFCLCIPTPFPDHNMNFGPKKNIKHLW